MGRPTRIVGTIALPLISLLACEAALQLADRSNRAVHALLMPPAQRNATTLADEQRIVRGNPYHREHDEAGYRNATRPARAEVVVLGDSQAYGSGVSREEAWPTRLGAYNMALPGYGPGHSLLQLEEALAFRPRRVIVAIYFGNDFADTFWLGVRHPHLLSGLDPQLRQAAEEAERRSPIVREAGSIVRAQATDAVQPTRLRSWISDHIKLYGLVRAARAWFSPPPAIAVLSREFKSASAALTSMQRRYAVPVDEDGWRTILTPDYRGRVQDDRDPRVRLGFEASVRVLRQIHERTRLAGVSLLVVLLPTKESVFWPRGRSDKRLEWLVTNGTRLRGELTSALRADAIAYVDMLPILRAAPIQPYFEDVDGHPNAEGHRLIAEAVAQWSPAPNRPLAGNVPGDRARARGGAGVPAASADRRLG